MPSEPTASDSLPGGNPILLPGWVWPPRLGHLAIALVLIELVPILVSILTPHQGSWYTSGWRPRSQSLHWDRLRIDDLMLPVSLIMAGAAGVVVGLVAAFKKRGRALGIAAILAGTPTTLLYAWTVIGFVWVTVAF